MTMLRFSGGEVIRVNLSLQEVRDLLRKALADRGLMELEADDGRIVVVNPQQVQFLQDAEQAMGPMIADNGVTAARA